MVRPVKVQLLEDELLVAQGTPSDVRLDCSLAQRDISRCSRVENRSHSLGGKVTVVDQRWQFGGRMADSSRVKLNGTLHGHCHSLSC